MVYNFVCDEMTEDSCGQFDASNEVQLCKWARMADQRPYNESLILVPFCEVITVGVPINVFLRAQLKGGLRKLFYLHQI